MTEDINPLEDETQLVRYLKQIRDRLECTRVEAISQAQLRLQQIAILRADAVRIGSHEIAADLERVEKTLQVHLSRVMPSLRVPENAFTLLEPSPALPLLPPAAAVVRQNGIQAVVRQKEIVRPPVLNGSTGVTVTKPPETSMPIRGLNLFAEPLKNTAALQAKFERWLKANQPLAPIPIDNKRAPYLQLRAFGYELAAYSVQMLHAPHLDTDPLRTLYHGITETRRVMEDNVFCLCWNFNVLTKIEPKKLLEISQTYYLLSCAYDLWNLYARDYATLSIPTRISILNAMGYVQQYLRALLTELDTHDKDQVNMFTFLRGEAYSYIEDIEVLTKDVPFARLRTLSRQAETLLIQMQSGGVKVPEVPPDTPEAKRAQVLADLTALVNGPKFPLNPFRTKQRELLFAILARAREAGIPPSNIAVRTLLLPWHRKFLAGYPQVAEFYREVIKEIDRSMSHLEKRALPIVTLSNEGVEKVQEFCLGKQVLILGGLFPKEQQAVLPDSLLADGIEYITPKPGASVLDFKQAIKKADVIIGFTTYLERGWPAILRPHLNEDKQYLIIASGHVTFTQLMQLIYDQAIITNTLCGGLKRCAI